MNRGLVVFVTYMPIKFYPNNYNSNYHVFSKLANFSNEYIDFSSLMPHVANPNVNPLCYI